MDAIIINETAMYQINPDRIKERVDARETTFDAIENAINEELGIQPRSLKRNRQQKKMKGDTLLCLSRLLDCTPYYFMDPSPLWFTEDLDKNEKPKMIPLRFWTYEIQTLSAQETRRQSLLIRGMQPEIIDSLTHEEVGLYETFMIEFIARIESSRMTTSHSTP